MFTDMIDFKLTVLIINFQHKDSASREQSSLLGIAETQPIFVSKNKDIYYGNTNKTDKCKTEAIRPT